MKLQLSEGRGGGSRRHSSGCAAAAAAWAGSSPHTPKPSTSSSSAVHQSPLSFQAKKTHPTHPRLLQPNSFPVLPKRLKHLEGVRGRITLPSFLQKRIKKPLPIIQQKESPVRTYTKLVLAGSRSAPKCISALCSSPAWRSSECISTSIQYHGRSWLFWL